MSLRKARQVEAALRQGLDVCCPFCGSPDIDAEFVDVGLGGDGMQVTPYRCGDCDAVQMTGLPPDDADAEEFAYGWHRGPGEDA